MPGEDVSQLSLGSIPAGGEQQGGGAKQPQKQQQRQPQPKTFTQWMDSRKLPGGVSPRSSRERAAPHAQGMAQLGGPTEWSTGPRKEKRLWSSSGTPHFHDVCPPDVTVGSAVQEVAGGPQQDHRQNQNPLDSQASRKPSPAAPRPSRLRGSGKGRAVSIQPRPPASAGGARQPGTSGGGGGGGVSLPVSSGGKARVFSAPPAPRDTGGVELRGGGERDAERSTGGAGGGSGAGCSPDNWKSLALYHEVKLRELLADDKRIPEKSRLTKVLQHYSQVTEAFPLFKTVFDLILSEVLLSVYVTAVTTGGALERVPFFDIVSSLRRETESLKTELFDARTEANHDTLLYELHTSKNRNRYLTHQVDKLAQENESLLEDVAKLNFEAETLSKNGRQAFYDIELQNRKAMLEIRNLTNDHTLMSYESRARQTNINEYTSLKHTAEGKITSMLNCSYEFSAYVQLMCQLELAENYYLNEYDTDVWCISSPEVAPLRAKLVSKVRLLRAELHTLEGYCATLLCNDPRQRSAVEEAASVRTDREDPDPPKSPMTPKPAAKSTQGDADGASDSPPQAHQETSFSNPLNQSPGLGELRAKAALQHPEGQVPAEDASADGAAVPATGGRQQHLLWEQPTNGAEVGVPIAEVIGELAGVSHASRDRFIENMMRKSSSVAQDVLLATIDQLGHKVAEANPQDALRQRNIVPLLETDPKRLDFSIDVVAITGATSEHVRTVHSVDPCAVMELPPKTSTLNLKFSKLPTAITTPVAGELTAQQQSVLHSGMQAKGEVALVDELLIKEEDATTLRKCVGSRRVWQLYTDKAGVYTPRAPRSLAPRILEQIVQASYGHKRSAVLVLHLSINNSAASKEVKEKQFGGALTPTDLITSLFSVLEERYHLPPVVTKVAFEMIASCEQLDSPLTQYFLSSLEGDSEADVTGSILSNVLHVLEREWPLSVLQPDVSLAQKEMTVLLEVMYPTFNSTKIDALLSDIAIFTRANFSLTDIRAYFIDRIGSGKEHHMLDAAKAVAFKSTTLKWKELDKFDFADACCSSINFTPDVSIDAVRERLKYRHQETCARTAPGKTRLELKELGLLAADTTWLAILEKPGSFLKPA